MLYQSALGGSWYEVCQDYALSRSLTWPRERKRLTGGFTLCNAAFQLSGTGTYSAGFWTWKGCSVLFCYNDLNFILCKYDLLFTLNTFCHCILNVFGIVCSYTIYIYIHTHTHLHILYTCDSKPSTRPCCSPVLFLATLYYTLLYYAAFMLIISYTSQYYAIQILYTTILYYPTYTIL